ncbi:4Fe-4S double cluster binding domain-containing protein [Isachenkonia alkalipeptolytica]|uniref:Epoxyqueuosine reductase n=1 Tax=Isachenkonia alkalipeptolytica TaxID=2565777 RepID=A0AA44BEU0_9CLOT|nr:4Fe-4S double cluster binding domain-containing protein [Isachenkonia alkalipeptolytica]NBG87881.1 epoxyqueuosine reductase [Isachenkonia alkalipeptolytica]
MGTISLTDRIKSLARQNGITYFGVGDLSKVDKALLDQWGEDISHFSYGISLGIPLNNYIVDQLPRRSEPSVVINYKHHAYDVVNQRLDLAASAVSDFIQQQGYDVFPIPASKQADKDRMYGGFSHKMSAGLAGLGWIGKNCLLITPEDGPRVRWTTILTDAPIKPGKGLMSNQCGDCMDCVAVCPAKAITGNPFVIGESQEIRFDGEKCEAYLEKMESEGKLKVCGMCLYVCPYGKNRSTKTE